MQQRQLRLGDILDDYCPRERRLTNHAVVAMIGDDVKQTRCTTCDAEHEYKHAKVPRQRRKTETPAALYAQVLGERSQARRRTSRAAGRRQRRRRRRAPTPERRVDEPRRRCARRRRARRDGRRRRGSRRTPTRRRPARTTSRDDEEGPVHRPLIRATLPRLEGAAAARAPDSRVHHPPAGRTPANRFRPRHQRGGAVRRRPAVPGQPLDGGGNARGGPRRRRHALERRPAAAGPHGGASSGATAGGRKRSK